MPRLYWRVAAAPKARMMESILAVADCAANLAGRGAGMAGQFQRWVQPATADWGPLRWSGDPAHVRMLNEVPGEAPYVPTSVRLTFDGSVAA